MLTTGGFPRVEGGGGRETNKKIEEGRRLAFLGVFTATADLR